VTRVFVNVGKALAAYERTLIPASSRFDRYVETVVHEGSATQATLTNEEIAGLKLFIGTGGCVHCHSGPLFTDHQFHNTGVPPVDGQPPDRGWADGTPQLLQDEFACSGRWSDASPDACGDRLPDVAPDRKLAAFKTPSLRGVASRSPYMHAGQCATLEEVLDHYRTAPTAAIGRSEIQARPFDEKQTRQIIAFLQALEAEP